MQGITGIEVLIQPGNTVQFIRKLCTHKYIHIHTQSPRRLFFFFFGKVEEGGT